MEYELDISGVQLVHWLRDEIRRRGNQRINYRAMREYRALAVPNSASSDFDSEAELDELTNVGSLEITPIHSSDPWLLRLRVEDELGPHIPYDESVSDQPEEIDLDGFEADFVARDQGNMFVTLEANTERARADFDLLLDEIERDLHHS